VSVLVIAPHPDDEVLGCGGTIRTLTSAGVHVDVVYATSSELARVSEDERRAIVAERKAALRWLGVRESYILSFPAARLDTMPEHQLVDELGALISRIRPGTVLVSHGSDPHRDHQIVFRAALVVTRPRVGQSVHTIATYETLSETEWADTKGSTWFIPNAYVDISKTLETKLEAMKCYRSQLRAWPESRSLESIEALARHRGSVIGCDAAEAFRIVRCNNAIRMFSD
jgi:LmbE family N-acetylglucosaminyl deacetylase